MNNLQNHLNQTQNHIEAQILHHDGLSGLQQQQHIIQIHVSQAQPEVITTQPLGLTSQPTVLSSSDGLLTQAQVQVLTSQPPGLSNCEQPNLIYNISKIESDYAKEFANDKYEKKYTEITNQNVNQNQNINQMQTEFIKYEKKYTEIPVQNQSNQVQSQNNTEVKPTQPKKEKKLVTAENNKKKKEAIDGQAREIIFKVIKFFESEKQNRGYAYPVENVVKRACAATGLSESTIKRIKRDGIRAEATHTRMTGPKKKRVRKTKIQLDYFQLCALRGIVNGYQARKEVPTLGKILNSAKHELNYCGGKESLRLILLNKLGIKFKKCEKKNKKPPEEQPPQPPQQMPQMQLMQHPPPMHNQMKPMETQCVYTNMIPPVSY